MSGRTEAHAAYLLHRRSLGEQSQLLELFSSVHGRVVVARRGAARERELQAFTPLLVAWSGRGEVPGLHSLEALGPGLRLPGRQLLIGLYLNELLVRSLPRADPLPVVYQSYVTTLAALAEGDVEWPLRRFEHTLLEALGYGLDLSETAAGSSPQTRYYCAEQGWSEQPGEGRQAVSVTLQRALMSGEAPDAAGLQEAKRLLRDLIERRLLSRPLKSRALFGTR
jgi:DNA repair protein RecO (recombination protein O)